MKEKSILLLTILLTGALINSTGFVVAQTGSTGSTGSTQAEKDRHNESNIKKHSDDVVLVLSSSTSVVRVTLCHIPPGNPGNAHTITVGSPAVAAHLAHGDSEGACDSVSGSTGDTSSTVSTSSIGNIGQYVSEFVHERIAKSKDQRAETINAIKNCREDLRNADNEEDRKEAREDCKEKLKDIREKYKAEREEYRQLSKEFRDSMKILIKEAKGHGVSAEEKEKALKDIVEEIKEMQAKIKEERQAMQEQMKEERQATKDKKEK